MNKRKRVKNTPLVDPNQKPNTSVLLLNIPSQILFDILCRLPTKSIIYCRRVCKALRTIITSTPEFAHLHFSRSRVQFLLRGTGNCKTLQLYEFDELDAMEHFYAHEHLVMSDFYRPILRFRVKFRLTSSDLVVLNSCNGFLCLGDSSFFNPIMIFNPVTGEFVDLPRITVDEDIEDEVVSGFGYSSETGQYKVVRLVYRDDGDDNDEDDDGSRLVRMAEVYTLGEKSWRRIGYAPELPRLWDSNRRSYSDMHKVVYSNGVFLHGFFHWISDDKRGDFHIIRFDFESEKFDVVPPLDHFSQSYRRLHDWISMGVLGGCLYVCGENGLWIMKEYGVRDSWTRLCCMIRPPMSLNRPIKYLVGGEVVVNHDNKCLMLCDPANKFWDWASPSEKDDQCWSEDYLSFPGLPKSIRTIAHTPSLFSFKDIMKGNKDGQCDIKVFRVFDARRK